MLFWHVGATTAFIRYAFRDPEMDLRFLALGAVLPDVIDLPLGILMWSSYQSPRLWAHTLLFGSLLMVGVMVFTRRGLIRKQWMLLAVGALVHLFFDAMWNDPQTLWWPFLGADLAATTNGTFGEYVATLLRDPVMWFGEIAGVVYLARLWSRSGLRSRDARERFLQTGAVSARIGRA